MQEIKVGDTVSALWDVDEQFTRGQSYIVTEVLHSYGEPWLKMIDDAKQENGWAMKNFELVQWGEFVAPVDYVNEPPHYTQYDGFEVIQIVEQLDYLRGTAVKYIMRAGDKWDAIQDLEKAVWYINRKIDKLKEDNND